MQCVLSSKPHTLSTPSNSTMHLAITKHLQALHPPTAHTERHPPRRKQPETLTLNKRTIVVSLLGPLPHAACCDNVGRVHPQVGQAAGEDEAVDGLEKAVQLGLGVVVPVRMSGGEA